MRDWDAVTADINKLLEKLVRRVWCILARYDSGGWPTRDSIAQVEDC